MSDTVWWFVFIGSFLLAICMSAMCSIAESVLLSLSKAQVEDILKTNKSVGKTWRKFKKDPDGPITSILAINTTAHTIGASLAGAAFAHLFSENWIWIFSIVFTYLMLQFTEILPKTIGVRHNQRLAFYIARPLFWTTYLGAPIIKFLRAFNKPFEREVDKDESIATVKEIALLTSLARSNRSLNAEQENIILAALKLSTTNVASVMVPIKEVSFLSEDMSVVEAIDAAKSDSHTRFPVRRDSTSNSIIGYINFKELVAESVGTTDNSISDSAENSIENERGLAQFVHDVMYVGQKDKAGDILSLLVKNHDHIAMVLGDDKKKIVGIITLEDLVEELLGEIEDEFDSLPETLRRYAGMVRVGGGLTVGKLIDELHPVFQEKIEQSIQELSAVDKNVRIADWVKTKLPEGVERNSRVFCGELCFWVKRVRRGRVFDVLITKKG